MKPTSVSMQHTGAMRRFEMPHGPHYRFRTLPQLGGRPRAFSVGTGILLGLLAVAGCFDSNAPSLTGIASPGATTITADPEVLLADGVSKSTITVQAFDRDFAPLIAGGDAVELKATLGTLSEVTDNNDGTYSAELTAASTPGLSRITGKINGGDITTDPAEVQFLLAQ